MNAQGAHFQSPDWKFDFWFRSALWKPFSRAAPFLPPLHRWTLDLCLHAPLLIPKINSSAHLCPSKTTLTPTTGGILSEKNVPLWLHGETSFWPFHLRPSLSVPFPPSHCWVISRTEQNPARYCKWAERTLNISVSKAFDSPAGIVKLTEN